MLFANLASARCPANMRWTVRALTTRSVVPLTTAERSKRIVVAFLLLAFIRCLPIRNASPKPADHLFLRTPQPMSKEHWQVRPLSLRNKRPRPALYLPHAPLDHSMGSTRNHWCLFWHACQPLNTANYLMRVFFTSTIDTSCSDFTTRDCTPLMITSLASFPTIRRFARHRVCHLPTILRERLSTYVGEISDEVPDAHGHVRLQSVDELHPFVCQPRRTDTILDTRRVQLPNAHPTHPSLKPTKPS